MGAIFCDRSDPLRTHTEGDHVWTRYRGGVREGDVSFPPNPLQTTLTLLSDLTNMFQSRLKVQKIVMDEREAREEVVANPPKVFDFHCEFNEQCSECVRLIVRIFRSFS